MTRMLRRSIEGVIKAEFQDDMNKNITNMKSKLSYTGARKRKHHSFGQISFIPKASGFEANDNWSCVELIELRNRS